MAWGKTCFLVCFPQSSKHFYSTRTRDCLIFCIRRTDRIKSPEISKGGAGKKKQNRSPWDRCHCTGPSSSLLGIPAPLPALPKDVRAGAGRKSLKSQHAFWLCSEHQNFMGHPVPSRSARTSFPVSLGRETSIAIPPQQAHTFLEFCAFHLVPHSARGEKGWGGDGGGV